MRTEIEKKLRLCPQLLTLSGVAMRLVTAARNPDVDLDEITHLVSHDPALAAKMLRIANSSLYPQFRQVHNLSQAISILGLNATVTLSLGFSLATTFKAFRTPGVDLEALWRRALIAAVAARLLGQQCQMHVFDELFLAALLQDIGRLALDAALPGHYAATQGDFVDHSALVAREREQWGADHLEAGAWLLQEWRLPAEFHLAILGSHDRSRRRGLGEMASFIGCVAVSGPIADIYLAADTAAATVDAQHVAAACLGLTANDLNTVLDRLVATLPEIQALFESSVLTAAQAEGLTAQAKELMMCRNLEKLDVLLNRQTREGELIHIADRLYDITHRDALTGVFNRRHFDQTLETAFAEAGGKRQSLSLAYLDLDYFKAINDQHGHLTGDRVLTEVATTIQTYLRPTDLLARYGGEEFVVLLPGFDRATAKAVIERVRAGVEELTITLVNGETVPVTLSAGLSTYHDGVYGQITSTDLIHAADQALYEAKRQGRNRIVQAP